MTVLTRAYGFVACVVLLLSMMPAGHAAVAARCHMCGMDAAKSQTEFVVHLGDGTQEHTCCIHCVYLLRGFMHDKEFMKVETRDYMTGAFLDAEHAFYLQGSSLIPRGSMAPFILAFADIASAQKYHNKYGGEIVPWTRAMAIAEEFDNELNGNGKSGAR